MGVPMSTPDYEKEQQIIVCRKAREIKKLRLSEDRISVLPEEILLHILSFVPTKFAIQTCIQLSKQWKPLWTSIPCLSFDIEDDNGLRFFNKVLHENKSPWIHKFRVDCSGNSTIPSSSDLESWIKEAVSRKAREIDLVITTCRVLLNSIITCETLVVLRLSGGGRFMDIIAGQEWKPSFPNLKTMVLHSVMFYGEKTFNTLVSCCPELENLSFRSVHWILGKRFVVNARKLKNLEIVLPFTVNQVQEYEINAPSLEFLDITDCVSYSVSFTNVGCLKKANVRLVNSTSCKSFLNCFKEFRNLESLSLSNPSSNTPRLNNIFTSTSLLAGVELLNLRRLELGSGWYGLLQYILFCSPNLRVLRLVKDLKAATCASLPTIKSSLSQLKVVEIEHLCDTKHNLDTLKYILRNGTMLEMVRIRIHGIEPEPLCNKDFSTRAGGRPREFEEKFLKSEQKCHELERKMRIQQEISGFSRGSTACRVTYY